MATVESLEVKVPPSTLHEVPATDHWKTMQQTLRPVASLRLTVVLFVAAILIILFGTLAQVEHDIWKVVHDYFRVDFRQLIQPAFPWINFSQLFVWIDPKLFFPPAFAPSGAPAFPSWLGVWFPKGWIIGTAMMVNLVAAHLVRFKVQAHGRRLAIGWGVIAIGALVTFVVIMSGSNSTGLQAKPLISYTTLWWMLQTTVFGLCGLSLYLALTAGSQKTEQRWLFGLIAAGLGIASLLAFRTEASNEATMRILYQVIKATFAGIVLLAGCIAVFKKRAGIVLLHAGIGLMMFYDVLVGTQHVESQMQIVEGETVNFTRDIRDIELAISEKLPGNREQVTVVDSHLLDRKGDKISDKRLPFHVEVVAYYPNSAFLGPVQPVPDNLLQQNPATTGIGQQVRAIPQPMSSGTDMDAGVDLPSAYLKLTDKSGKDLGTHLVSARFDAPLNDVDDTVNVDGTDYRISLRFRRIYNDYKISLKDVQKNDYQGTKKARDYSSFIVLENPETGTKLEHRIWMNNPMRYAGKTFYQSNYAQLNTDEEVSTLQVVDNAGWMTPYVACMMVVVGLLFHFGQTLLRFLHRRLREVRGVSLMTDASDETTEEHLPHAGQRFDFVSWGVTAVIVGCVASAFAMVATPKKPKADEFHLNEFGELPMWYKGRPQPLDSFARNSLMQLSDRQSFAHQPFVYVLPFGWKVEAETPEQLAAFTAKAPEKPTQKPDVAENADSKTEASGDKAAARKEAVPSAEVHIAEIKKSDWLKAVNRTRTELKLEPLDAAALEKAQKQTKLGLKEAVYVEGDHDGQKFVAMLLPLQKEHVFCVMQGPNDVVNEQRKNLDDLLSTAALGDRSAIGWLLELMAYEERAASYRIVRIESDEIRNAYGLDAREGLTYSFNEIKQMGMAFIDQANAASKVPSKERTLMQRKTLELANRILFYQLLESTLGRAPELPPATGDVQNVQFMAARAQEYFNYIRQGRDALNRFAGDSPLPLVIPTHLGVDDERISKISALNTKWETVTISHTFDQFYSEFPAPTPPAIHDFMALLQDYRNDDVGNFNADLATYQKLLKQHASAEELPIEKVEFEGWYNRVAAFNLCSWLYVFAFVLAVTGWLVLPNIFERSAFWLIALIFCVHTLALVGRIYISGRPPVTNLYSSAVFIGWAAVLGGMIIEAMTKLGIGNVVAAMAGFLTLRIAHGLAADGDTFVVLEAVLDTQFWLATHVVCITLGYATTYLAGLFGLLYVILGVFTPRLSPKISKELTRMTYGVICFAIFFSFWGTVLGGLWADDSWGRFWGWDPKENGALIIVLWNALVLHARWGGMVRDRGMALLAVAGNVVVSWSWFGVNELGVGLHSYGFTEGRLLMLGVFVLSQLVVIAIGLLPRQLWWSNREPTTLTETL